MRAETIFYIFLDWKTHMKERDIDHMMLGICTLSKQREIRFQLMKPAKIHVFKFPKAPWDS
jgi:hypothetical protein